MDFAKEKDIDNITEFYRKVIDAVNRTDIRLGWNIEIYPNRAFVSEAVLKGEMLMICEENEILAAAVVNHTVNPEYDEIDWIIKGPADKVATIHGLAVSPDCRGGEFSARFLRDIEDICRKNGDIAIHLDVIDTNIPAYKLYERNGYREMDCVEMYYESVGTRKFWMMEHVL